MGVDPSRIRITEMAPIEVQIGSHDGARDGERGPPGRKASDGLRPGGVWTQSTQNESYQSDDDDNDDARRFDWELDDLDSMKVSALSDLARKEKISSSVIEDCMDSERPGPKGALIRELTELREKHSGGRGGGRDDDRDRDRSAYGLSFLQG